MTHKAYLHVEENGLTKITIPAVNLDWTPGQHCFLRFTSFGLQSLSSHPFTICSTPSPHLGPGRSELVFYIRHQRGLTQKLYNHALEHAGDSVPVLIDGPYGGINMQRFSDADRLLVIAGGSGAGWVLPFVELFSRQAALATRSKPLQTDATSDEKTQKSGDSDKDMSKPGPRSLRVVLATREASSRSWFLSAIGKIFSSTPPGDGSPSFDVAVHLTGDAGQNAGASATVDVEADLGATPSTSSDDQNPKLREAGSAAPPEDLHGRPRLPDIINKEGARASEARQSLAVFVCGPEAMLSDVRNAVAKQNLQVLKGSNAADVYLHAEHFSWA